jgi:predicted DsbA family dithiol-disulfide isomerase
VPAGPPYPGRASGFGVGQIESTMSEFRHCTKRVIRSVVWSRTRDHLRRSSAGSERPSTDPGLRVVYKEFPILGPGSEFAAGAALAARKQGKYVPFHTALMRATDQVTEQTVIEIARETGLDTGRLEQDMRDPAIEEAIARNLQLANALGITGTRALWSAIAWCPGPPTSGRYRA